MTTRAQRDYEAKLAAAADQAEQDLIEELLRAFALMQSGIDANAITSLVDAGDVKGAVALLSAALIAKALAATAASVRAAFAEGGALGASLIPRTRAAGGFPVEQFQIKFSFDSSTPAASTASFRLTADLITNISAETRAAIRATIKAGFREGRPVPEIARNLRSLIGLNVRQTAATVAYRRSLIDAGHSVDRVNVLADRYTKKKLRERAQTIARFETMNALNTGSRESWLQAQQDGWIGPNATKKWIASAGGGRWPACPKCAAMNGVTVPLHATFPYEGGAIVGPPGHPRCRCCAAILP